MTALMRRRMMMEATSGSPLPIMNPAFDYIEGYYLDRLKPYPYLVAYDGFAVTDFIYVGTIGTFKWFGPLTSKRIVGSNKNMIGSILQFEVIDGNYTDYWNNKADGAFHSFGLTTSKCYVRFGFDPDTMSDLYAWNDTTGQVYFAGINTPYYGKTNIND